MSLPNIAPHDPDQPSREDQRDARLASWVGLRNRLKLKPTDEAKIRELIKGDVKFRMEEAAGQTVSIGGILSWITEAP